MKDPLDPYNEHTVDDEATLARTGWMKVTRWVKWDHPDPVMRPVAMTAAEALSENERLRIASEEPR